MLAAALGAALTVERVVVHGRWSGASLEGALSAESGDFYEEPWRVTKRGGVVTVGPDRGFQFKVVVVLVAGFVVALYAVLPRLGTSPARGRKESSYSTRS